MKDRNDLIRNIVTRARNDIGAARHLLDADKQMTDIICFHCQQAAEKYLKAWLHYRHEDVPRTHNLIELLALCERGDPEFSRISDVGVLTHYAVEMRYAEDFHMPSTEEARRAVELANGVEKFVTPKFGDFDLSMPEGN